MKEIEQLCSSFLWSGPELKSTGAKVAWRDICKLQNEGGLGIRQLKEVNIVYGGECYLVYLYGENGLRLGY